MSPAGLDELGLAAALAEWMDEQFEKRHGLKTQLIDNGLKEPLEEELRTFLFRSVRELLNNTVKHAQATSVNVWLEQSSAGVKVIIRDVGVGFDRGSASNSIKSGHGFGLFSIQERLADLGGTLEIISEPGKGTEVILTVSLAKGRESWSDGE